MYARREVLKLALGALPVAHLLRKPTPVFGALQDPAPNSKIGGVQVGIIAPYAFRGTASSAEDILDSMLELGINAVELQHPPVEQFAGAPSRRRGGGGRGRGRRGGRRGGGGTQDAEALRDWRLSAPMEKMAELRKMYEDAGVRIYAFKLDLRESMPDEEYDYCFQVAKALGASHITMELNDRTSERVGRFAAKHEVHVGYHNHTQVDEQSWDAALAQSDYNGINLDVGHFTAAISKSPIPFIQKHHARIQSMHLKDRNYGSNGGDNMPWGQGETPLKEVLQLMKAEQYDFPATIELEYRVPEGSTVKAELEACLQYCKDALA